MPSFRNFIATAVAAAALTSLTQAAPTPISAIEKRALKFPYGSEKVRGVNLGGWFVLEPWITPSIFEAVPGHVAVDEYSLCQAYGPEQAKNVLEQHWSTWITQNDFNLIASHGMNHVRIPIGYWSVSPIEGDPYVQGAYAYLGEALNWAQAAGIKVLIDLHGAPLSQNGFDNSGRRGAIGWTQGSSIQQTHAALQKIQADHASHPAVSAIELVNEPMGPSLDRSTIEQFYYDGYGDLTSNPEVAVTFHDAFLGDTNWNDFGNNLPNWLLDTHHYEVFDSGSLGMTAEQHVQTACGFGAGLATNNKPSISGEWTGAMTDCALYLNGFGVGARWDGTYNYNGQSSSYIGSCDNKRSGPVTGLAPEYRAAIGQYISAQMDAFEEAAGWIFWTWKTEGAPEWDMQELISNGVIASPVSNRAYPGMCG